MSDPMLLAPAEDAVVAKALRDFALEVRRAYGDRLKGLYLFGSRARGDHTAESDADVAVVLADGDWRMTGADPEGIDLRNGSLRGRLDFDEPVTKPDDLSRTLADLARRARAATGVG